MSRGASVFAGVAAGVAIGLGVFWIVTLPAVVTASPIAVNTV